MAAPAVLGRSGNVNGSDNRSHTITLPGSIAAGERLFVVFSSDQDPASIKVDEAASGTGWEQLDYQSNGVQVAAAAFTKVAEGSDALTLLTQTAQQSSHVSLRIEAANRVAVASSQGSSTNSDPPNLALNDGSPTPEVLWVATRSGDAAVVASAAPSGYANLQTQTGGASGASTNTAEKTATLISENPGTFTSTTEQWICYTVAFYNGNAGKARLTQEVAEMVSISNPTGRVSQLVVEMVSTQGVGGTTQPSQLVIAT